MTDRIRTAGFMVISVPLLVLAIGVIASILTVYALGIWDTLHGQRGTFLMNIFWFSVSAIAAVPFSVLLLPLAFPWVRGWSVLRLTIVEASALATALVVSQVPGFTLIADRVVGVLPFTEDLAYPAFSGFFPVLSVIIAFAAVRFARFPNASRNA